MGNMIRAGICAAAIMGSLSAGVVTPQAAGALAIGSCAACGYAFDDPTARQAQAAALEKCAGSCKQAVTTKNGCGAFAVDGRKPCGPHGFANAPRRRTPRSSTVTSTAAGTA